jgi:hypothetical protein
VEIGEAEMTNERVYKMKFSVVYPLLIAKAERKGRTKTLVDTAATECVKMEAVLRVVSVENEPNPAKINWRC